MNSAPLGFFTTLYSPDFWRERDIVAQLDATQLASVPRRGFPGLIGEDAMSHRLSEQTDTRSLLESHIMACRPPKTRQGLLIASQNVQTFNEAFPKCKPLSHPVMAMNAPLELALAQLTYELAHIERESVLHARVYEAGRELGAPLSSNATAFELFMAEAEEQVSFEMVRVESKYADLMVPIKGVTRYTALFVTAISQEQVHLAATAAHEVRVLLQLLKRLLNAGQKDLDVFEALYSKAAPIMRETASPSGEVGTPPRMVQGQLGKLAVSPSGPGPLGLVDDASIEILLHKLSLLRRAADKRATLPNLFGPGQLEDLSAAQVSTYGTLCGGLMNGLNELRRLRLGPVLAELRLAIASTQKLLRLRESRASAPQIGSASSAP